MQIGQDSILTSSMMRNLTNTDKLVKRMQDKQIDRKSGLYEVCVDFEAIFIKQMLNVMRKTVHKNGLLDGGFAEEIFEDMLYDEYSQKMARNAQFGLANILYNQLSK